MLGFLATLSGKLNANIFPALAAPGVLPAAVMVYVPGAISYFMVAHTSF